MHMADALVVPAVATTMYVCSAAAAGYSVHKVRLEQDTKKIPVMGVMGAFVFAGDETTLSVSGKEYTTSKRVIAENDIITIDLSPQNGDTWGDYARTIIIEKGKAGKAGIQPHPTVVIRQNRGIKGKTVGFLFSIGYAVGVMYNPVEFIFPGRGVADRHLDVILEGQAVVKIVSAVMPPGYIRGEHDFFPASFRPCLLFPINHTFIAPVGKIRHRCGPAYVIILTVLPSVKSIMASVDVDAITEHMGFPVGHILPKRQIRVVYLIFHSCTAFDRYEMLSWFTRK